MKYIYILCLTLVVSPLCALNAPELPDGKPVWQAAATNTRQNARQAVRLGNQNFKNRVNTPDMTAADIKIAVLIAVGFQPFFDKLDRQKKTFPTQPELQAQYRDEFTELVQQLRKLLINNQSLFVNPLLIDEKAADEETLQIVQEAIANGHF